MLFIEFIPMLKKSGLGAEVDRWTMTNPARAFSINKRLMKAGR